MFPFLVNHGEIVLPTFFVMVMVASLASTFYVYWQAGRKGFSRIAILDMAIWGTISGFIGARIFHILVEAPDYYWEDWHRVFYVWQGGFVGYGAFIGITLSSVLYLKLRKFSIRQYGDLIVLGCPLIIFFVRIGCLGAGCCYGKVTNFPLHLVFNNPASDAARYFKGLTLHATQIYDLINALITFGVVHWVTARKKFDGEVILAFFATYASIRFLIEFLRGDADRGIYLNGMISTAQVMGIVILAICGIFYWYWKKNAKVHNPS